MYHTFNSSMKVSWPFLFHIHILQILSPHPSPFGILTLHCTNAFQYVNEFLGYSFLGTSHVGCILIYLKSNYTQVKSET